MPTVGVKVKVGQEHDRDGEVDKDMEEQVSQRYHQRLMKASGRLGGVVVGASDREIASSTPGRCIAV